MFYDYDYKLFANGLQALSDKQVLETMLYNIASQKEINIIVNEIGSSFLDVLGFGYERFEYLGFVNPKVIYYLEYLREFAARYLASSYIHSVNMTLDTADKLCEYFKRLFLGINREEIYAVGLDDNLKFVCKGVISVGIPDCVEISIRKLSEFVILNGLTRVVLAHNHPQGSIYPSEDDIYTTKDIVNFLAKMDTELIDHIIVSKNNALSLRASFYFNAIW